MDGFRPHLRPSPLPDPDKRVRYTLGMILGVDDMQQEQYFFLEQIRLGRRLAQGAGTLSGLAVSVVDRHFVAVAPGFALDGRGRMLRVQPAYRADLNAWLAEEANRKALRPTGGPGRYSAYVLLRYVEALTDPVFLPGDPGRDEAETEAPSRICDSFLLEFAADAPNRAEERALERLGALMSRLRVGRSGDPVTEEEVVAQVRRLADGEEEAAEGEPGAGGEHEEAVEDLWVWPETAHAIFRLAYQTWILEVKPELARRSAGRPGSEPPILLARLDFGLDGHGAAADLRVHDRRPYVLTNREIQEYMTWTHRVEGPAGGDLDGPYPDPRVTALQGRAVAAEQPPDRAVLTWNGDVQRWEPQRPNTRRALLPFATITRVPALPAAYELWLHVPDIRPHFDLRVHALAEDLGARGMGREDEPEREAEGPRAIRQEHEQGGDDEGEDEGQREHGRVHGLGPEHGHEHGHEREHEHDGGHGREHGRGRDREGGREHEREREHDGGHGHERGHEHEHGREHEHEHEREHDREHDGGREHEHGREREREHEREHEHEHGREHEHDGGHGPEHERDRDREGGREHERRGWRHLPVEHLRSLGRNRFVVELPEWADQPLHLRFDLAVDTMSLADGRSVGEYMRQARLESWVGFNGQDRVTLYHFAPQPAQVPVAAGLVSRDGKVRGQNLRVAHLGDGLFSLRVPHYSPDVLYIVKGTPLVDAGQAPRTFEVVRSLSKQGILVRISPWESSAPTGFMVEILRVG